MKFERYIDFEYKATPRKFAAIGVRKRHEREKYPLLAAHIGALQAQEPTPEEEMERRCKEAARDEQLARQHRAGEWLRARRRLRSLPKEDRDAVLARYNGRWIPKVPEYLLDLIHCHLRTKTNSGESDGRRVQTAMPTDGMQGADRDQTPLTEVLFRCVPAKGQPGDAGAGAQEQSASALRQMPLRA